MALLCGNTPFQNSGCLFASRVGLVHIASGILFGVFCLGNKAVNTSVEAPKEFSKTGKLFQKFLTAFTHLFEVLQSTWVQHPATNKCQKLVAALKLNGH